MSRQSEIGRKYLGRRTIRRLEILVLVIVSIVRVDSAQWVPHPDPVWTLYATNVGSIERLVLQDGSRVDLNTGSEIKVRITGGQREVVLTHGEALFTVRQRADWPFSVRAGGAKIRTVGTKFSVRLRGDDEADVLVIEGRIAIDGAIDGGSAAAVANLGRPRGATAFPRGATAFPLIVSAGESVAMSFTTLGTTPGTTLLARKKLPPAALERRTAWTDGWIWFYQDPLPEAVAEFNRYHRQQLVLVDPALASLEIGGRFRSTDLASFIAALEHSFDVRALSSGANAVYLTGRCPRASQQCNWPMVQ